MMRLRRYVCRSARRAAGCGAVLLAVVALTACSQGPGDVVARVGETPITRTELEHWLLVRAGAGRRATPTETVKRQVLGFLISSQWTIGEASELGVKVSDEDARKQLELLRYETREGIKYERLPMEAKLQESLANPGLTSADRLWLTKLNMLATKIEQKRLAEAEQAIAHAQVVKYYDEHKRGFLQPERRDLAWIVTYSESTLQKAVREVRSGKSLVSVAKHVSLDPPTIEGLELRSAREKAFAKHVFAARPHVLAGPFRQQQNHYEFEVTRVTPARQLTLAQAEASIRQALALRLVSTELPGTFERRWTARTSCRRGYIVPKCREYAGTRGRS
jgi:hypothetical protein